MTIILGNAGFIGKGFLKVYNELDIMCTGTSREKIDLLKPDIGNLNADELIICAGMSKILECEVDKDLTERMTIGTIELIRQLNERKIKPIYISSDIVFDGKDGNYEEMSHTNPLNEYAKQKDRIERYIQWSCEKYLIIRLPKIFSLETSGIFHEMAYHLSGNHTIKAAIDQIFSPTLLDDAIKCISKLDRGTYHVCSPEVWSRYDLALKVADTLKIDRKKVIKINLEDLNEPFKRPKNTSMKTLKINHKFTNTAKCIEKICQKWRSE